MIQVILQKQKHGVTVAAAVLVGHVAATNFRLPGEYIYGGPWSVFEWNMQRINIHVFCKFVHENN
jgi:hypothetical protein